VSSVPVCVLELNCFVLHSVFDMYVYGRMVINDYDDKGNRSSLESRPYFKQKANPFTVSYCKPRKPLPSNPNVSPSAKTLRDGSKIKIQG
jgi:hypothetical protein